jgi:hypothetical protein
LAESIENRVTRLEREVAFLKAQGVSKEEQNSLMDQRQSGVRRYPRWARTLFILNAITLLGLIILIYIVVWGEYFSDSHQNIPKRSDSFFLPGTPRP